MLAVIGGTGFYQMEGLSGQRTVEADTPFGKPSAPLTFAKLHETEIAFLPRHGTGHRFLPHEINYRANIYALKEAGVRQIVAVSACGSLREEIRMGNFVLPDQYFDHTRGQRKATFFGDGLAAHISTAKPASASLRSALLAAAHKAGAEVHADGTFACIEGPRLGSRAESFFLRDAVRADIVGMTCVPEAFLAREAQMCYATVAIATDYDCWQDDPALHVSVAQVFAAYGKSLAAVQQIISELVRAGLPEPEDEHRQALAEAVITPYEKMDEHQRSIMQVLRA